MANNSEILGEEAAVRQIVEDDFSATNGVLEDDSVMALRNYALAYKSFITAKFPNVLTVGDRAFMNQVNSPYHRRILLPKATSIHPNGIYQGSHLGYLIDMGMVTTTNNFGNHQLYHLCAVIYRSPTMVTASSVGDLTTIIQSNYSNADGCGYIYVPRNLISSYQSATNWATIYANKPNVFRALEDYTVDGTTTGDIDESKMFVPVTPIFSLDNTEFNGSSDYVDTNINMFDGTHGKMTIILDVNVYEATSNACVLHCFDPSQNSGFKVGHYQNTIWGVRFAPPPRTDGMGHLSDSGFKSGHRTKFVFVIDNNACYVLKFIVNDKSGINGNNKWSYYWIRDMTEIETISKSLLIGCGLNTSGNYTNFFNGRINKLRIYDGIIEDWQIVEELNIRPEDTP